MAPIQRVCFDTRSKVWILFGRQYTAQLLPPRSQSIAHLSFPFSPLSEASPSCVCLTPFFFFRAVSALRGRGGRKPTELVCPQLPLRGGQWVWWEGSTPPLDSQIASIMLIRPRKATYCLGLGQGGYQFRSHSDVFSQKPVYFWLLESETQVGASFSTFALSASLWGVTESAVTETSSMSKLAPSRGPFLRVSFYTLTV